VRCQVSPFIYFDHYQPCSSWFSLCYLTYFMIVTPILVMSFHRVVRKVPELSEGFIDRAAGCLSDKNHGVILTGVTLMLQLCESDPVNIVPRYPTLC
jgi:hypothetical protein